MPKPRIFTDEEEAEIYSLYMSEKHLTQAKLAKEFNVSIMTMNSIIKRCELKEQVKAETIEAMTNEN